jgi:hypothetical protein
MSHSFDSKTCTRRFHSWTPSLWATAIHDEWLIDLAEWEQARGVVLTDSTRIAFTRALWDVMARRRFSELGRFRLESRLAAVLAPVRATLDRVLKTTRDLSPPGAVADFTAHLPMRTSSSPHASLRLHVELGPRENPLVTVGFAHEFVRHPLESLSSKLI